MPMAKPLPGRERNLRQPRLHHHRGAQRVEARLGVGHGRAPRGEQRVADVLVQRALCLENDLGHLRKVRVQHRHDVGRVHALGKRRETADVGLQDRGLDLFPAQRHLVVVVRDGVDDLR
jgi:hypothetical protein